MPTIRKRGDFQYQAIVRRHPFPAQSKTFTTRKDAEAWAARIESEILAGSFSDPAVARQTSLGDLLERYGREISPQKKGGELEISRLRKLATDPIAQVKIAQLLPATLSQYRDRRLSGNRSNKAVSGSTVNRELNLISHVLTVATKDWGIPIAKNPVSEMRRPKENRARTRRLQVGEEERLLAELEPRSRDARNCFTAGGSANEWARPVVIIALETAMRRSEILSLHWSNVYLEGGYVRLNDTKNGEARDVPLSSRAIATLSALPRHMSGRVFPITADALKKVFVRACQRGKLDDLRFHDLRHEATSRIAERLPSVLDLSAVTGHKSISMLKRYYHPRATDLAKKLG